MDKDEKTLHAITAAMDGQAAIVREIGPKRKVSLMELICLINFAEIGILHVLGADEDAMSAEMRAEVAADLERHLAAIRHDFNRKGDKCDGLDRLLESTLAVTRSPRFAGLLASGKRKH